MNLETIEQSLLGNLGMVWQKVTAFLPSLAAALVLLVGGYYIAKFTGKMITLGLRKIGLDRMSESIGLAEILVSAKLPPQLSQFVGKICFLFIFMIFLISTADVLQLEGLSNTINKFIDYLPNIVGALLVFFLASIAGHYARQALQKAGQSMNLQVAKPLSQVVYGGLLLVGAILAIGQLKIETQFLTQVLEILLMTTGVAVALSLGLGSRNVSKNLISGVYLKESLSEGSLVRVGDYEGILVEMKPVSFVIKESSGRQVILPNSRLLECEIMQSENS